MSAKINKPTSMYSLLLCLLLFSEGILLYSVIILLSLDLDCVTDADIVCIPFEFCYPTISISFSENVLFILSGGALVCMQ